MNSFKMIAVGLLLLSILLTACGPKNIEVDVAVVLTQTAAVVEEALPEEAAVAETETEEIAWINGTAYCVYGPPNPPMVIYAVDGTSGDWYSVETEGSEAEATYMLEVPPGTYHLAAYCVEGQPGYAAYTGESTTMASVTVEAWQAAEGIVIRPPGQSACGAVFGVPASPDGRFAAVEGPAPECLAGIDEVEAPLVPESDLMRIEFQPGLELAVLSNSLAPGSVDHYVLKAMTGQEMTVMALPAEAVRISIYGADDIVLLPDVAGVNIYSGFLHAEQDYHIDVYSTAPASVVYSLEVSIPAQSNVNDSDTPGSISGGVYYPSGYIPPFHVVAFNLDSGYWFWAGYGENANYYSLTEMPPGEYHIVAYTENGEQVGGHASAGDGELLLVTVNPGQATEFVDISIWLESGNPYFPADPL